MSPAMHPVMEPFMQSGVREAASGSTHREPIGQSHLRDLALGFGRKLLARHGKDRKRDHRRLEMWRGLKPSFFCEHFAARLKSCPVTKLASMESLRQPETFARLESSN